MDLRLTSGDENQRKPSTAVEVALLR